MEMFMRLRETAAVGLATCLDIRLNRPSTISLVNSVGMTALTAAAAVWAVTTSASLIVPILFAATSVVALAYTTYKIYQRTQSPSEAGLSEWEGIFDNILIGNFTDVVKRLEAIVERTFPDGVQNVSQVLELENTFKILDVRMTRAPIDFSLLMTDSLACSTASKARFLSSENIEKNKQKILSWTKIVHRNDLSRQYNETIDDATKREFRVRMVINHAPLLLSSTLYGTTEFLKESEGVWGDFANTKAYLRAIAPSITEKYVGAGNLAIFQEMLAAKDVSEFFSATKQLNRDELIAQAYGIPK